MKLALFARRKNTTSKVRSLNSSWPTVAPESITLFLLPKPLYNSFRKEMQHIISNIILIKNKLKREKTILLLTVLIIIILRLLSIIQNAIARLICVFPT